MTSCGITNIAHETISATPALSPGGNCNPVVELADKNLFTYRKIKAVYMYAVAVFSFPVIVRVRIIWHGKLAGYNVK